MPKWSLKRSKSSAKTSAETNNAPEPLELAQESLRTLLHDNRIPKAIRESLADDYQQVEQMLEKMEHGHLHIAVFGRVSVGKSALLNALLGETRFGVSALHGETTQAHFAGWQQFQSDGVFLIDTPGINEISGEDRERLAHEVAGRSDLVLFVVDGDLTESELVALRTLAHENRPILLIFNKIDRYTQKERSLILEHLQQRTEELLPNNHILTASALPSERLYIHVDEEGNETETYKTPDSDVSQLRDYLWQLLEREGHTLSALNASLFAGKLSDQVAARIIAAKQNIAERVVRSYCVTKGVAVALNPIPIADIVAASAVDATMVVHLARIYGMQIKRDEAGQLVKTIGAQMALLIATVWGVNLISSALKAGSAGLSTLLTASAQGAVAYYSTFIVGQAAEQYFSQGKSWGESGPKQVVKTILKNLSQESILKQARGDIVRHLKTQA